MGASLWATRSALPGISAPPFARGGLVLVPAASLQGGGREGEKKKKRENELSTSLPFKAGICPAMTCSGQD